MSTILPPTSRPNPANANFIAIARDSRSGSLFLSSTAQPRAGQMPKLITLLLTTVSSARPNIEATPAGASGELTLPRRSDKVP